MLEEIVENEKSPPAETALAMLSFLQTELPAGGTAGERRFIRLFGPLCDRIFGQILGAKEDYRHKDGGWFSAQYQWTRSTAATAPSNARPLGEQISRRTSLSINTKSVQEDPVLKLLGSPGKLKTGELPPPTLIEAISKESENRPKVCYKFPFLGLPKPTQDQWLAVLETALGGQPTQVVCTENGFRLFGNLLSRRPLDQAELQRYRQRVVHKSEQQRPGTRLSPRGFQSPMMPRQPTLVNETKEEDASPHVMLSMLEYYLFLFMRYPMAAPLPKAPGPQPRSQTQAQRKEPYGEKLYMDVFKQTLRHFLPYEQEDGRFITFDQGFRQSELLLRIIIALWLETQAQMDTTAKVVQAIQERKRHAGILEQPSFDLDKSYELVQTKYDPPVYQVQKCLRSVLVRVIADPSLSRTVLQRARKRLDWCLTPAMTALQAPFYNQVRATFRHASIHFASSPFFSTFDAWLIWIEPWNISTSTKTDFSPRNATQRIMHPKAGESEPRPRTLLIPKYNQKSRYTSAWQFYVACNLFMYTVPLALFLRRARELDFSSRKFDGSIQLVKRVFRVFSPELVNFLSRLVSGIDSANWQHLVARHREVLGPYAPPAVPMTLSSFQTDMHNLLDEIYMQRNKTLRELDTLDRLVGKVEGLFGQREEKELNSLLESARLIAQLPLDYKISPASATVTSDTKGADVQMPDRSSKTGELSEKGRTQLVLGEVKCNPEDVSFVGDKMRKTVITSHEIGILVQFTVWLSDWLNAKLGIDPGDTNVLFRFNFRFLADYRNLLFTCLTTYIVLKLLF